jgi:hypothetical protein
MIRKAVTLNNTWWVVLHSFKSSKAKKENNIYWGKITGQTHHHT